MCITDQGHNLLFPPYILLLITSIHEHLEKYYQETKLTTPHRLLHFN